MLHFQHRFCRRIFGASKIQNKSNTTRISCYLCGFKNDANSVESEEDASEKFELARSGDLYVEGEPKKRRYKNERFSYDITDKVISNLKLQLLPKKKKRKKLQQS